MLRFTAKKFVDSWGLRSSCYVPQILSKNRLMSGYNGTPKVCNPKMASVGYTSYSDCSNFSWKRPEGPPRIWRTFEGRRKSSDGTIPRFTVQDVPEEMVEDVIDFMLQTLLNEESFSTTLGIAKDPLAVEDMRRYWRNVMRQGMSIVALTNGPSPESRPVIAGANILAVVTAQDKAKSRNLDQFETKSLKTFYGIVFDVEDEVDVLSRYGVDKYLGSVGLAAHPSFRGNGIGENILKVREDIGRAYQISVTEAMFTMRASQISANRAGFELQIEKEYSQLKDYEGNFAFPGVTGKFIHVMTKRLY